MGKQFLGDPSVDEAAVKLSQFSMLAWLQRFPHWHLGARLMPPAPPAPGVHWHACTLAHACMTCSSIMRLSRRSNDMHKVCQQPGPDNHVCPYSRAQSYNVSCAGVATFRAAAMAEGKDPDKAVQEARAKVLASLP